jgi:DNA repair protein RadD
MVGRGGRLFEGKKDCLILDFAGCIEEHGPIDLISVDNNYVAMATCQMCRESFSRAVRVCPLCGWEIPKQEIKRLADTEKSKRFHGDKASKRSIISEPETFKVDGVRNFRHQKDGSPDSLRIQFRCGVATFRYWCCLDHPGPAGRLAQIWWKKWVYSNFDDISVDEAICDLLLNQKIQDSIRTITVRRNGKYNEIIGWNQKIADE